MMSPMLHSRALQTFFKTSIETFSFLPNLAKAIVLIPAFKRKSVFDISRSIKSFQSFLYDASIFLPSWLSVNTSFACNISAPKIKSNAKSAFLNIFCNKNGRLFPACQGVALCEDWSASGCVAAHCAVRVSGGRYLSRYWRGWIFPFGKIVWYQSLLSAFYSRSGRFFNFFKPPETKRKKMR